VNRRLLGLQLAENGHDNTTAIADCSQGFHLAMSPWPSDALGMNDEVLDGSRVVGRVTAGAKSPHLGCAIGYVRFKEPGDWAHRDLLLRRSSGPP
jgi:glycine cleavage system aminomethyltransferase T